MTNELFSAMVAISTMAVGIVVAPAGATAIPPGASQTAAPAASAPTPLPPVGQTSSYSIKGNGIASVSLPGADAGLPVGMDLDVALVRTVSAAKPDGTLTSVLTVTRQEFQVNDQPMRLPQAGSATVTTDPAGKLVSASVDGRLATVLPGLGDLQSVLFRWQLPSRSFKPGESWTQSITLPTDPGSTAAASPGISFQQSYSGIHTVDGHPVMSFASHLIAPVHLSMTGTRALSGFRANSGLVKKLDQTANYDPSTGLLQNASTQVEVEITGSMGEESGSGPLTVRIPMHLTTQLDKVEVHPVSAPAAATPPQANTPSTVSKP